MTDISLAGQRILLVEDEMLIAMMVESMLEEIGCTVAAAAATPDEAIRAIETNEIDAAVLDLNLDGQDSFGIASKLADRRIPFLFATGYGSKGLNGEFPERPVLTKPFRLGELEEGLKSIIAGRKIA